MPTGSPRHRFTTWQISGAPAAPGVYLLWEGDEVIYIGSTSGEREAGLREEFHIANLRFPRCNANP
jgi:hypothetical protein